MYIVRDKKTKQIIHENPAPLSQQLSDKEIYFKFDPKQMEIGKLEGDFPEHYKVDEDGMVVALTLEEKVSEGIYLLNPHEKVEQDAIIEKTLSEKVAQGLIDISPNQKVLGGEIVEKNLQEMLEEGVMSLDEIKAQKIEEFSSIALSLRSSILPDYKIQNALMGIYGEKKAQTYKATVERFRNEFFRLKEEVEKTKTLKAIEAIKGNFPEEIVGNGKMSSGKGKATKKKR